MNNETNKEAEIREEGKKAREEAREKTREIMKVNYEIRVLPCLVRVFRFHTFHFDSAHFSEMQVEM